MASATPDIAVAVVSWNTRELLDACLASLHDVAEAEVWVVDNASTDGSAAMVAERHPWVRLLALDRNSGYGAAVARVAANTSTPFVAAANADLRFAPDALAALLRAAATHPEAGALAPRLVLPDGSTQHSVHPFPGIATGLRLSAGLPVPLQEGRWDPDTERDVDWAHGALLMIRRRAWDAVGGFDGDQWLYAEDLDLCWRLRRAGWTTRYVPAARVEHAVSAATATVWDDDERAVRTQRSAYAWMLERQGPLRTRVTALAHLTGPLVRCAALRVAARRDPARFGWRLERQRRYAAMHRTGLEDARSLRAHRASVDA